MEKKTFFNIPAENMPAFYKAIDRLSRRAEKNAGFKITPMVFQSFMRDNNDGTSSEVMEVYLDAPAPIIEGWTFVARIDHANEVGNIIRSVPNLDIAIPDAYRSARPNCDHCNHNRQRRDTFLIWKDGEFRQVGSSCLKDFFGGIDPAKIARWAEYLAIASEAATASEERVHGGMGDRRFVNVADYMVYVRRSISLHGFISRKMANMDETLTPTSSDASQMMRWDREEFTQEEIEEAAAAIEWAATLIPGDNDYLHNISVVARSPYAEVRSLGLVASILPAYRREMAKLAPKPEAKTIKGISGLLELFGRLSESGLKHPKIVLQTDDGSPVVLKMAGERSSTPGAIHVTDGGPYGDNIWYGRLMRDGQWNENRRLAPDQMASVNTLLAAMGDNPAEIASKFGRVTGNCFLCAKKLTDKRSIEVGYGKVCAKRAGLPWG